MAFPVLQRRDGSRDRRSDGFRRRLPDGAGTLDKVDWNNSTLIEGDVAEEVLKLKQQPGKDITISGSATLVRSLLRKDLVDELHLMIHPVVVGSGRRLFEDGDQHALEPIDSKTFSTGVVYATYRPARAAAARSRSSRS